MLFDRVLSRMIRRGTLTVRYPDGQCRVYRGAEGPAAGLDIRSRRAEWRLVTNPGLAFGEGYMSGELMPLDCSLYEVMDLLVLNLMDTGHPGEAVMEKLRWLRRHLDQLNPAPRARRNVAHHYDLNGRLYALFLDRDRQYSCAYFPTGQESLEEAQEAKKRHIAAKLRLDRPDLEVLDIGCGWGGMALHLAREHGARVTGITLSTEQLEVARARAEAAGLSDRVRFELMDYRDWARPVDRIVSVGMFEHVGIDHYRRFFRTLRGALREDGVALVHAIGRSDGPGSTNPWIAKYIFPGGYSPALSEVLPAVEKSGLWVTDIEILRLHYAQTIAHWRRRFAANRDAIQSLYDERFCRMFEFYLIGSELAFRRMGHMNWQLQLTRQVDTLPLTRDYMAEAEARGLRPLVLGSPIGLERPH
ncbi:cyclopropane-fatty-acyl-phospholipid synthase family protein [Pseudoroseomonas cervicalis]|uniref:SAM-dependent methyltransferase n=1 Tax=Teichococcus cervicalis TaxID=204525 RepID=UPI0022F1A6AC|nr:cyclopropane-fatty-acyl-phospholipid synthase family protein [Pseudoroseomonas cervicalis]WBV43683.1 cyclopropane-fatty-acyl-phospholipid synthase [Pseudoroseomonas cervicalis]